MKHPLGFRCYDLAKLSGVRLVLHVWPRGFLDVQIADEHSHRWRFWSLVLAGRLIENRYTEGGDLPRTAYAKRNNRSAELTGGRPASLRWTGQYRRRFAYRCDPGVIHRIEPAEARFTATLVLVGRATCPSATVYREDNRRVVGT